MSYITNNYCLNCNNGLVEEAEYCQACGQSRRASILSFRELWANFWTTIFNVDNSFFATLRLIARPDKLTQLYVAGKRKKHINPVRLFLISLVFFVTAAITSMGDFEDNTFVANLNRDYYSSKLLEKYDDVIGGEDMSEEEYAFTERLKSSVFDGVVCLDADTVFNGMKIIDVGKMQSITKQDFVELSEEEVIEKYNVKGYFEKLNYRQYIRINKDPNASNKFLFNNAMWGLVPCILILCLLLKLLYRNHKISYLEHLILVSNTHSFLLLFWMLVILGSHFFVADKAKVEWLIPTSMMLSIAFAFLMMFIYYGEGFLRSFLKYVLALTFYMFFGFFFIVVSAVISGFIF